jgi:predicted RecA/RadA family phage recombinase
MIDITSTQAGGALTAGDVLVIGDLPCVIHTSYTTDDYSDSRKHAVAAQGGLYSVLKGAGSGAITAGAVVYWDDTNNVVTTTAGAHKKFGWAAAAAADAASVCDCIHAPAANA